jgi:hypothetical protein
MACWPGQSKTTVWAAADAGRARAACAGLLRVKPVIVSPAATKVSKEMNQARFTTPPQEEILYNLKTPQAGLGLGRKCENRVSRAGDPGPFG